MMHNTNNNIGSSNQTLLVCSPATINANAANNLNNNVTRSTMSLAGALTNTMTITKFPPYSSNNSHLLTPVNYSIIIFHLYMFYNLFKSFLLFLEITFKLQIF